MKTHQVNDKFLYDFFSKISYSELELLRKAIKNNFVKVIINKTITSPDWKNSRQLYLNGIALIKKNLFDISDNKGFPKARLFVEKYILNGGRHIKIGDILMYYLQKQLVCQSTVKTH